jgi:methionine synthase I (cobalamin-dependent)
MPNSEESTPFSILSWLETEAPVISDGSLRPVLERFGLTSEQPACLANIQQMDWVRAAHKSYQRSGANFFRTNTAGATLPELTQHGVEDRTEAINNNGMALLREALGTGVITAGVLQQVKSTQVLPEPLREQAYGPQVVYLSDTGANFLWCAGFTRWEELAHVAQIARRSFVRETVLHLSLEPDQEYHEQLPELIGLVRRGQTFIGLEASPLQPKLEEYVQELVEHCGVVSVILGEVPQGEETGPSSWFQRKAERLLRAEVAMLGLGPHTTPKHVRWLRQLLDQNLEEEEEETHS